MAALGHGLPLVPQPYAAVAQSMGWSEQQVLDQLTEWLDSGVLLERLVAQAEPLVAQFPREVNLILALVVRS